MKIIFVTLSLVFLVVGCASPEVLKYGATMSAVEKRWGRPDETTAFKDYQAKGYYSISRVNGSWSSQGGSASGFGYGETYTPTAIVWTYKEKGKALFFEKRGLLFDEQHTLIMKWKLVGWQNLDMKPGEANPAASATTSLSDADSALNPARNP
jgi:hypothetical protein